MPDEDVPPPTVEEWRCEEWFCEVCDARWTQRQGDVRSCPCCRGAYVRRLDEHELMGLVRAALATTVAMDALIGGEPATGDAVADAARRVAADGFRLAREVLGRMAEIDGRGEEGEG